MWLEQLRAWTGQFYLIQMKWIQMQINFRFSCHPNQCWSGLYWAVQTVWIKSHLKSEQMLGFLSNRYKNQMPIWFAAPAEMVYFIQCFIQVESYLRDADWHLIWPLIYRSIFSVIHFFVCCFFSWFLFSGCNRTFHALQTSISGFLSPPRIYNEIIEYKSLASIFNTDTKKW